MTRRDQSLIDELAWRPDFNELYLSGYSDRPSEEAQLIDSAPARPGVYDDRAEARAASSASVEVNSDLRDNAQDPASTKGSAQLKCSRSNPAQPELIDSADDVPEHSGDDLLETAGSSPFEIQDGRPSGVDSFGKAQTMHSAPTPAVDPANLRSESTGGKAPDAPCENDVDPFKKPLPAGFEPLEAAESVDRSAGSDAEVSSGSCPDSRRSRSEPAKKVTPASSLIPGPPKRNGGRFTLGTSGNLTGRPRGSRNRTTLLRERLRDGEDEQLLDTMFAAIGEGDKQARKAVFECLYPKCKERTIQLELGPLGTQQQVAAATARVIKAVADGLITLDEGGKFIKLLEFQLEAVFGVYLRRAK